MHSKGGIFEVVKEGGGAARGLVVTALQISIPIIDATSIF